VIHAIGFVLALAHAAQADDLVLHFCPPARGAAAASCAGARILRIPRQYLQYDNERNRNVQAGEWLGFELAVQFPDFRPWRDLPLWQRWLGSRKPILIQVGQTTTQTVRDLHASDFLGDPKPVLAAPAFGLVHYQRETWGTYDIYVPPGGDPGLHIKCPADVADDVALCTVRTFTDWGLFLSYRYPRSLLPHWAAIQGRVLRLMQSAAAATGGPTSA
jgi:hypothetical protein